LDQTAAVKILALHGEAPSSGFKPELIVTASAYTHRLSQLGKTGLDLLTYPHPRQTPLADHKTTNYLYYFLAGQWAKRHGADEALILNPDGSVSETNTANLLAIRGKYVIRPTSAHVLAGIMEKRALRWFEANGYTLERKNLMPEDLLDTDGVILTNSLMGPVAVLSLNGKRLPDAQSLCSNIRTDDMTTLENLPGQATFL
jgi:para-aminobenzoate synthetase component 1